MGERELSFNLSIKGQSQLIGAVAMAAIMLTLALYSLQFAERTSKTGIQTTQRTEMRSALESAIRFASHVYHSESGCDPVLLEQRLDNLLYDGSIGVVAPTGQVGPTGQTTRTLRIAVNDTQTYFVTFDPVQSISTPTPAPSTIGTSMDSTVTVWTEHYASSTVGGQTQQKVSQSATLLNNCTYPCTNPIDATEQGVCLTSATPLDNAAAYQTRDVSAASGTGVCFGSRKRGDLNNNSADCTSPGTTGDNQVGVNDLRILREYLRSGVIQRSCAAILEGTGDPRTSCADLNRDGLVNEQDLNIMEKFLRGYLPEIPTQ